MKKIFFACLAFCAASHAMDSTSPCEQKCYQLFTTEFDKAILIKNNTNFTCYQKSINKEMTMAQCQKMQDFEYKKQKLAAQALYTTCLMKCTNSK